MKNLIYLRKINNFNNVNFNKYNYNKFIAIIKFNDLLNLNLYVNLLNVLIIIDNNKLFNNAYKRNNTFN